MFIMVFLFFIGHRTVELSPTMKSLVEMEKRKNTEKDNSNIEDILEGTDVPMQPDKVGVTIDYAEDLELPEDSELKNWKVYEYEQLPQGKENAKKLAKKIAKVLFGDYFSKADKYEKYGTYYVDYRDKEKNFQFSLNLKRYSVFSFTHSSQEPEIEEPEDGDWDRAYREYSEELFQKLALGSWDGEQAYLELEMAGGGGENAIYHYRYVYDEKRTTDISFPAATNTETDTIFIEYNKGVLKRIETNNAFLFIKNIRDAKVNYSSIEEAMEDAVKKLRISSLGSKLANYYDYYRIDSVNFFYIQKMTGEFKEEYNLVPVMDFELTNCHYLIEEQNWSISTGSNSVHYGIMLESGEELLGGRKLILPRL